MNEQPELTPDDERLATAAGGLLRKSADGLDAATLSKLNQARQTALAGLPLVRSRHGWQVPAYGTAAVAVLMVALWVGRSVPPTPDNPVVAEDVEVLLAGENLEMMDDLEFYAWLDPGLTDAELQAELETLG